MADHEKARKFGEAAADTVCDAVQYESHEQAARQQSRAASEASDRMMGSLGNAKTELSNGNLLSAAGHFIKAVSESNTSSAHARQAHEHSSEQHAAVKRTSERLFGKDS